MIKGLILLFISGICQGSFGLGYKKYSPFSWEAFWGIYSLFCLLVAVIWTLFVVPDPVSIISSCDTTAFILPFICGILWGLSTIAFSKSVIMIGISMCFGINMGVSAVIGTLVPFFTTSKTPSFQSLIYLLTGTLITLAGITIITKAGLLKEKAQNVSNTKLGIVFAVISGLCSGIMNIGFSVASPLGAMTLSDISASAIQWFPVLSGGMTASIIFCAILMFKNKTWNTYLIKGSALCLFKLFLTSLVWFAALALYGISSKMIGDLGSSVGWLIFNAIALVVSNLWGIFMGEWKDCVKAKYLLALGNIMLVIAWVVIMNC